jgi:NTE family protein
MTESLRVVSAPQYRTGVTSAGERLARPQRYSSKLSLVLPGGGARAAYQVGVLAALAERLPDLEFPILTGVSAGAINTIYLAAHPGSLGQAVAGLEAAWRRLTTEQVFRVRPGSLVGAAARWVLASFLGRRTGPTPARGFLDTQPLREFLEVTIDVRGIQANIDAGRLRTAALTATSINSGRSVTFVQGRGDEPAWEGIQHAGLRTPLGIEHVMASAAIPILFPAESLIGEFFCDGSVGQNAPLAPALRLGARAAFVIGLKAHPRNARPVTTGQPYPSIAEVSGLLLDTIFLDQLEADADQLARINSLLAALPAQTPAPLSLRPVDLLLLRPRRDLATLSQGLSTSLPRGVRRIVDSMGGRREGAAEFLSYLLFEPGYTSQLAELGYEDVGAQWPEINRFFETLERPRDGGGLTQILPS